MIVQKEVPEIIVQLSLIFVFVLNSYNKMLRPKLWGLTNVGKNIFWVSTILTNFKGPHTFFGTIHFGRSIVFCYNKQYFRGQTILGQQFLGILFIWATIYFLRTQISGCQTFLEFLFEVKILWGNIYFWGPNIFWGNSFLDKHFGCQTNLGHKFVWSTNFRGYSLG